MYNNTGKNATSLHPSTAAATTPRTAAIPYHLLHHHQVHHPVMIPFSPSPSLLSFSASASAGGADDDDDDFPKRDERFPQWSNQEIRDFIEIRAQFELEFTTAKRDKNLWEIVANRMRDKGYRRTPDHCKFKWNTLVSRYKEQEAVDVDNSRQCLFFNELHLVFTARSNRMQPPQLNADTKARNTITNASEDQSIEDFSQEQDDDEEIEVEQAAKTRTAPKRKKTVKEKRQKIAENENYKNNTVVDSLRGDNDKFHGSATDDRCALEGVDGEACGGTGYLRGQVAAKMESLERERVTMEKSRRESDEQRWLRDESRAEKRDALLTMLLNKLVRDEI